MKDFIRKILLNTFSLFAVGSFFPGLIIPQTLLDLLWAATVFTLTNKLAKPIIKLLLLPFNLVTLGLFQWISNVVILIILTRILTTISVVSFSTLPISQAGFAMPTINVSLTVSFILVSLLLSLVYSFLDNFLTED